MSKVKGWFWRIDFFDHGHVVKEVRFRIFDFSKGGHTEQGRWMLAWDFWFCNRWGFSLQTWMRNPDGSIKRATEEEMNPIVNAKSL